MSKTEHSPLRLTVMPRLSGSENHKGYLLIDDTGYQIATVIPFDQDGIRGLAYANEIVRAVNSHEALVDALEKLLKCREIGDSIPSWAAVWDDAEAALALANLQR